MADEGADVGFTVRDRRGRDEPDEGPAAAPSSPPPPAPRPAPVERDLTGLFLMLASLALAALGEAPDAAGEVPPDPEQAAELIDVLILLREKTEGRRTAEETRILEEVVYDLQLRWVNARKRSGR